MQSSYDLSRNLDSNLKIFRLFVVRFKFFGKWKSFRGDKPEMYRHKRHHKQ